MMPEQETAKAFHEAVNMIPKEVRQTKPGETEPIGQKSGKRILEIIRKPRAEYDDEDYSQMGRTVSYVHRHLAERPKGDVTDTRWRYSLMNWGHDPSK